ncbi:MAG: biotin--[acetyl-CoA-carboxylase] ligase [Candidatus Melainabacteria bacterium]|nr:biotin--[acetyl-CoA-carboxylase] ligase [Candidatus Melainabacteria bacterium]
MHDVIDSTNTRIAALSKENAEEGTIVFARQQTAGRGRLGRQWVSPPNSGLYMSVLLRPEQSVGELPVITLGIGVAAAKAIFATTGLRIGLKWVNDLIYDGKKLGGILCEVPSGNSKLPALVIGIGINTTFDSDSIPDELKEKLYWLEAASGTEVDTTALATELCFQIESVYESMKKGEIAKVLDEWRLYSITLGQEVVCTTPSREVRGIALDVTNTGALIVQTSAGREELLGGEISVRTAHGSYT